MTQPELEQAKRSLAWTAVILSIVVAVVASTILLLSSRRSTARAVLAASRVQDPSGSAARELDVLVRALGSYRRAHGRLPTKLIELSEAEFGVDDLTLSTDPGAGFLDPWNHPYRYTIAPDGSSFEVRSLGRDGEPGGAGDDADLVRP